MPAPLHRSLRSAVLLPFLLLLSVCGISPCLHAASPDEQLPDYLSIPLLRGSLGQPVLRGEINGRNAFMYVDTGAPITCVDESKVRRFHLQSLAGDDNKPLTVNANGTGHGVTIIPTMKAGALRIDNTPAVLIDFRELNRGTRSNRDKPNDAIIGLEILTSLGAILDFDTSQILVKANSKKAGDFGAGLKNNGWTEIPLHLNESHLAVRAVVNKTPVTLIVDTGSPTSVLDRGFSKKVGLPLSRRVFASRAIHFQDAAVQVGRVSTLKLGNYRMNNLSVAVFDLSRLLGLARETHDPTPDGLLGCETLVRHRAFIDCENMKLYLRPPG